MPPHQPDRYNILSAKFNPYALFQFLPSNNPIDTFLLSFFQAVLVMISLPKEKHTDSHHHRNYSGIVCLNRNMSAQEGHNRSSTCLLFLLSFPSDESLSFLLHPSLFNTIHPSASRIIVSLAHPLPRNQCVCSSKRTCANKGCDLSSTCSPSQKEHTACITPVGYRNPVG
ncbi:hypothetical protein BLNAU_23102 [Blattamonas nauphoetae]|uniref:Uncharacterized protein n=1 Tax=Blattamonas nauphoetae TaxID=2049346 RepID=A0ABQ9WSC1_9EUKA|nr:hypothetical protein BLNAU_23102 [Blattamonas nauphoetae]